MTYKHPTPKVDLMADPYVSNWTCLSCRNTIIGWYPNTPEGMEAAFDDQFASSHGGLICDDCLDALADDVVCDADDWEDIVIRIRLAGSHL